jgi:uncharacterized protein
MSMENVAELFAAIRAGNLDQVRALLGANPALATAKNEQGQSPILAAVYSGRREVRDLLLSRGTTLEPHEAIAAGHLESVQRLVDKDPALAKAYSPDGFPVFALAAAFGHLGVVQYLLEKGVNVNAAATNGTGYTALTGAVTGGHKDVVALLLKNGADPNYRYGPGYTPLLAAAANGHMEIVKTLLEYGADAAAKTNDGKTAAAIAAERKHAEVADFLRGQGAAQSA